MKKLLHFNAAAKTAEYWHETASGDVIIEKVRDETQKFDDNKAIHNMTSSLDRWGDGQICLRGVPFELVEEWKKRGWFNKESFWRCLKDERAAAYKVFGK